MSKDGKLKVGMYWGSGCGGCDIALLEIGARILDLIERADVAFWPCAADFKYAHVASYPDAWIDICFFNGGVRNSEQEEIARLLRKKSRVLVAYGACAAGGGIPALANLVTTEEILDAAYHSNPSIDNPGGVEPLPRTTGACGDLHIPSFYPAVLRLSDIVPVDYTLPGCPPQAEGVWETILALIGPTPPDPGATVGCGIKTVCDVCSRTKRQTRISAFRRPHCYTPEPGWCLLEQGILCMGPATRSGCGALCIQANQRCEGCYGPPAGVTDQGAAMIGALGSLLDCATEDRAREMVAELVDLPGTLYRFTLSSSHMKMRQ